MLKIKLTYSFQDFRLLPISFLAICHSFIISNHTQQSVGLAVSLSTGRSWNYL